MFNNKKEEGKLNIPALEIMKHGPLCYVDM